MNHGITRRGFLNSAALQEQQRIEYRSIGKTGLKVSTVGFGCMVTSDASVIERSIDLGINYFDTSRDYQGGNNERMLGAAIKGRRAKVHVSTKTAALDRPEALENLETSLKTLGTDYIDIWMLHDRGRASENTPELGDAMLEAKKKGKARFIGVSTHRGQAEVIPAMVKAGKFDAVMVTYNFAVDAAKTLPPIQMARQAGLGVIGMKVLAGSFRLDPATYDRAKATMKKEGACLAALKWALRNDVLDVVIPSMTDMDQLAENVRAMSEQYSETDGKLLASYVEQYGPIYCRMCGNCDGTCAKGLPVSDMQRVLLYLDGYRQFPLARERFLQLPERARQASCDCPVCTVNCPHGIDVAGRLSRARHLLA
jgi:uncharacterized protein